MQVLGINIEVSTWPARLKRPCQIQHHNFLQGPLGSYEQHFVENPPSAHGNPRYGLDNPERRARQKFAKIFVVHPPLEGSPSSGPLNVGGDSSEVIVHFDGPFARRAGARRRGGIAPPNVGALPLITVSRRNRWGNRALLWCRPPLGSQRQVSVEIPRFACAFPRYGPDSPRRSDLGGRSPKYSPRDSAGRWRRLHAPELTGQIPLRSPTAALGHCWSPDALRRRCELSRAHPGSPAQVRSPRPVQRFSKGSSWPG